MNGDTANPRNVTLDYDRLMRDIDVIRKFQKLDSLAQVAIAAGISNSSLYGLQNRQKGIDALTLVRLVHWSKVDLHDYIIEGPPEIVTSPAAVAAEA